MFSRLSATRSRRMARNSSPNNSGPHRMKRCVRLSPDGHGSEPMCLGVPGQVVSIAEAADTLQRSGRVSFGGVVKEVSLAFVPDVQVGEYVIVHAGFALNKLDETE